MLKQVSGTSTFTPPVPFRILNKGPDYFRKQMESSIRKPSAVERLEADKLKYVKSQQVASTRQEPVKASEPVLLPTVRRTLQSPRKTSIAGTNRTENSDWRGALNLETLRNLILFYETPSSPTKQSSSAEQAKNSSSENLQSHSDQKPVNSLGSELRGNILVPAHNAAVRRVDVRPSVSKRVRSPPCPSLPKSRLPSSTSSRGSSGKVHPELTTRQQLSLHRSKSDLSDRYSRVSANLERFFNYCGLDPEELENMGMECLARASSDIVSLKLHSASNLSSEYGRSQYSSAIEEKSNERIPYGISIIERNARVIKWLYSCREAKESQRVSPV
ncbi:protein FAM110B-like [Pristis pectinata]|uniref:protein FAM110B-like n=1 Tax=Pristis pectinata TaxID=685728 RepID=UPI00223D5730|nr:protein FAM110B-like [Pristis pectinata]XP_051887261.1 protein FAM110B-like [Pristis pectinata]XP_051887263.1 protein FAM110B-like [Pristis pectinata]XP_051887264.1 protein FAM110B-like [Pristis pectinata]XP_051887265.1 protein FAM110B-like [Pristis pectinata]XP_051887266.1 protein FAM110B-like [Pristis pectinata]